MVEIILILLIILLFFWNCSLEVKNKALEKVFLEYNEKYFKMFKIIGDRYDTLEDFAVLNAKDCIELIELTKKYLKTNKEENNND